MPPRPTTSIVLPSTTDIRPGGVRRRHSRFACAGDVKIEPARERERHRDDVLGDDRGRRCAACSSRECCARARPESQTHCSTPALSSLNPAESTCRPRRSRGVHRPMTASTFAAFCAASAGVRGHELRRRARRPSVRPRSAASSRPRACASACASPGAHAPASPPAPVRSARSRSPTASAAAAGVAAETHSSDEQSPSTMTLMSVHRRTSRVLVFHASLIRRDFTRRHAS